MQKFSKSDIISFNRFIQNLASSNRLISLRASQLHKYEIRLIELADCYYEYLAKTFNLQRIESTFPENQSWLPDWKFLDRKSLRQPQAKSKSSWWVLTQRYFDFLTCDLHACTRFVVSCHVSSIVAPHTTAPRLLSSITLFTAPNSLDKDSFTSSERAPPPETKKGWVEILPSTQLSTPVRRRPCFIAETWSTHHKHYPKTQTLINQTQTSLKGSTFKYTTYISMEPYFL